MKDETDKVTKIGEPSAEASRVVFVHGALSAPHPEIVKFYWESGIKTVIALHGDFDSLERLRQEAKGQRCGDAET